MVNSVQDDPDSSDRFGFVSEDTITILLATIGMIAIAVGFLGILLTDATITGFDSIYAPLAVLGLACYVALKLRKTI